MIHVYQYPRCGTCRNALKWLDAAGVQYRKIDIVAEPPSQAMLRRALQAGIEVKRLFNTSGESYRAGNFKERMTSMSEREMFEALAADGKLVKRPFVVTEDTVLVGFDESKWSQILAAR